MNEPMTARDALDAALRAADFQDEPYDVDAILAALPPGWTLSRDAIALGVAWAAVEAVLPEDGSLRAAAARGGVAMTWRHVEQFGRACMVPVGFDQYIDSCGCPTPTPDPASPCGYAGCVIPSDKRWHVWHDGMDTDGMHHKRVPTRCLACGHPIEEARP